MSAPIYTIIVDDQISGIEALCGDLVRYPQIEVVETVTSAEKARSSILKHQPNLLFLDIEMPQQSGLELLKDLSPYVHPGMCVVFYSAFDKYMIDALRASAFDYLLKPYLLEELDCIVNRVKDKLQSGQINFEASKYRQINQEKKIAIHTLTGVTLVNRLEVLYFEYKAKHRCWQLVQTNLSNHKLQISTSSRDILSISDSFTQISRDCILNLDFLSSIENKTFQCFLHPPHQNIKLQASRRYYFALRERLELL